jgi:choline dehydrogenase-like flavoprotein
LTFQDARQLSAGTRLETEVCVVGAGAAGITLALALRDAEFHVLLLESGGFEMEEATQALYEGESRGISDDLDIARLRFFGGTTNHWAGWCRPLEPDDFNPPNAGPSNAGRPNAGSPNPGSDLRAWPLSRTDLDPYYRVAQTICELGPYEYDDLAPWLQATGLAALEFDPGRLKTALFQVSPPTRFGTRYRDDLERASNVTVLLHANLLEILTDTTAARVTGLRVSSLEGPPFEVRARIVVLATGGMENARLLLLSNSVREAGLGNDHDLVGRYFMDHPWLTGAGFAAFAPKGPDFRLYLDETAALGTSIFGTVAPGKAEPGIGGFRILLRPSRRLVEGVNSLRTIGKAIGSFRLPPDGLWHHLGQVLADYDAVVDATYKTVFGTRSGPFNLPDPGSGPIVGALLDVNVEQFPNPDSRITLSRSRDALGKNRLVTDWRPGAAEKRTVRRALELLADEFGRLGIGRVRISSTPDGDTWSPDMRGSRHHMGTTRMSADPRTGVVDANCRVHGMENLYVAGSSVFPGSGFANPTLTIVALALRLADELRRRFG